MTKMREIYFCWIMQRPSPVMNVSKSGNNIVAAAGKNTPNKNFGDENLKWKIFIVLPPEVTLTHVTLK